MSTHTKKRQWFQEACTRCGLKITPQRMVIFEELSKAKDHPSADELYKRVRKILPHISFDTVYRTLLSFSETGMVRLVEGYGEVKRFDPDLEDHHHLHCLRCQKIIDFCDQSYADLKIPAALKQTFDVVRKRVVFEGLCRDCKNEK
ncbi:MAG TPA: transcriptional repressor [Candidatus Omnitrophota bacterium]|nr:transcriptional repressor [Candidatus Omnitrophota bacterium]HPB68395.1 transcriptional repressor [Candidatus Omnitrophota bacterium]HQO58971.1 transcriptional repressor [Candidatus Omnitrophota bacterium]